MLLFLSLRRPCKMAQMGLCKFSIIGHALMSLCNGVCTLKPV